MSNNSLIVKNTIILFFRMIFVLLVGLYTTQQILKILGLESYGIFILASTVISLSSFLSSTLSSSTTRFISHSIGKKNIKESRSLFSNCLTLHLIFSIIIFSILTLLAKKYIHLFIKIDVFYESIFFFVFQVSSICFALEIIKTPFNGLIIAKENFGIYARFEIISVILKLIAVIALQFNDDSQNHLKIYIVYILLITISMVFIIIYFCVKNYDECTLKLSFSKKTKEILSFSSWDLYGNIASLLRFQGTTILINNFFGLLANTAIGISNQIQSITNNFVSNLTSAIKPQIFKSYAENDKERFISLLYNSTKYSTILLLIAILPLILEIEFILKIWLKEFPQRTIDFTKLILIFIIFSNISSNIMTGIHATGNIKKSSLINGSLYLTIPIITYLSFKNNFSIITPFILNILFVLIAGLLNSIYLKSYTNNIFSINKLYLKNFLPSFSLGIIVYITLLYIQNLFNQNIYRFIFITTITEIVFLILIYFLVLDSETKNKINGKLGKLCKNL